MAFGVRCGLMVVAAMVLLAPSPLGAEVTPSEVARYLDETVPRSLETSRVPGAAVAVVHRGEVVALRGYGMADREAARPVDPTRTLFRIASVTKLLTWTAVLQLVERGEVDLDTDVNRYLRSVRVPAGFGAPVTLRGLMTHTAGFEDIGIGTARYTEPETDSLSRYLSQHLPARVRPPGTVVMYSNHGAGLAGLVVEEVSGVSYEAYVEERILEPLGMTRTSAHQPPPESLLPDLARSYVSVGGTFRPTTYTVSALGPAAGACATAEDMAAFMIAHLEGGSGRAGRILEPATVELMHRRAFGYEPDLAGWTLGFQELYRHGRRLLFHDGFYQGYVSLLLLVPDEDIGLFVAYNGSGGGEAVDELLEGFLDRFVADVALTAPQPPAASFGQTRTPRPGLYVPSRRPYTTIEKLSRDIPLARLKVDDEGSVWFLGRTWTAVRAGLYADSTSDDRLGVVTRDGRVTGVAVGSVTFDVLEPWQNPRLHLVLALIAAAALVSALAVWPVGAVLRRRSHAAPGPRIASVARWIAGGGAALSLASTLSIVFVLATAPLATGVPASLSVLTLLPCFGAAAAAVALALVPVLWARRTGSTLERVHYTLVAIALAGVTVLQQTYGILGPHLG